MLVKLNNGLTLLLPDDTRIARAGFFVLDGTPSANPDLTLTPANYIVCELLSDVYELKQREVLLGTTEMVVP